MAKEYSKPPAMSIDTNKKYTATFETSRGTIVCELYPKEAPITVNSFVFLANEGYYNGVIFHRVINEFMIQGGDPSGTGRGGPGYEFENENRKTSRRFTPGTLAMANRGPHTNGSQFFIMHGDSGLSPSDYTIFGAVQSGQEVVNAIATTRRDANDRPLEPVTIKSLKIAVE